MRSGLAGGKMRSLRPKLFSLSSNSECNGRLDVSLGPADVCGLRKDFVRDRSIEGGEDLVGFWITGADAPKLGGVGPEPCVRGGDLDLDRKEQVLSLDLAEATCRSDWLVETTTTSRSAISTVSGPV